MIDCSSHSAARLRRLATVLATAAALTSAFTAHAQSYPAKPLRLMHGFAAGGNADIISRILAERLTQALGQQVVVDAKTGAGGNLASEFVAKSAPDGYTLILLTGGHAVSAAMYKQLAFDPIEDFAMISTVVLFPFVIGTGPESPMRTIADVLDAARRSPGKLTFSSVGVGSTQHLAGELFKSVAGVDITHVPYRGGTTPINDVMAGRVDLVFDTFTPTLPQIKAGKLRALAVTSSAPAPALPDVPPVAKSLPGYEVTSWVGVAAPAKTPMAIVERLNRDLVAILAQADVKRRFEELGSEVHASSPTEMRAYVASEIAKWKRVVQTAGIERQ